MGYFSRALVARALVALAAGGLADSAQAGGPQTGPAPPVVVARHPSVVQDAIDAGFKACAGAMDEYVRFLHPREGVYDRFSLTAADKIDASSFVALTAQPYPNGDGVASISAVKNANGGCDVIFSQAIPVIDQPCGVLRETAFKDWTYVQALSGGVLLESKGDTGNHAVLTPMKGGGCLVIRHAIDYNVAPSQP